MPESFEKQSGSVEQAEPQQEIPEEKAEQSETDVVARYEAKRNEAARALELADQRAKELEQTLAAARAEFGLEGAGDSPSLDAAKAECQKALEKLVAAQANYPGDWTLLLMSRLQNDAVREKFMATRRDALPSLREGAPSSPYEKAKQFATHYQDQMEHYDENLEKIFSVTNYAPAAAFGKQPEALGSSNIGEAGNVFSDARENGESLTPRQKNIIEAHEKGHGMRDFEGSDAADIRSALNLDALAQLEAQQQESGKRFFNYLSKPEEIVERMAQLKNYFGFSGSESLTRDHLAYAKQHYVEDTGLDNGISNTLKAVTPDHEDKFLEVADRYSV
jgi:hypothetical protein